MAEEVHLFTKEEARSRSILEVAEALGMEMKRNSSHTYEWKEHDSFKIDTRKNTFYWYSRGFGGDVIKLVEVIKEVSFKEAMAYLRTGAFPEASVKEEVRQPFVYTLARYEELFVDARDYLKQERGLSDETIATFKQAGLLAQAKKKAPDGYLESVIVFKSLDKSNRVIGASLQGITPNKERHEGRGYLKQILYNSDGMSGMSLDIGTPKRLIFSEAPIDLMSYYEAKKGQLSDVRLVSMDGLKEATISRYAMELLAEVRGKNNVQLDPKTVGQGLADLARLTTFFQQEENHGFITLAVDNDKAGRGFIERLEEKGIVVQSDLPPLREGEKKMDWNDYLKEMKEGKNMDVGNSSIEYSEQEKKSLERTQETFAEGTIEDLPDKQEAAPLPEATLSQPLDDLSPNQTQPQPLLHFSINEERKSINKRGYHSVSDKDMVKLNRYSASLKEVAQWYLTELADSTIHYLYQDMDSVANLQVSFDKDKFIHLTGVFPYKEGQSATKSLTDFVSGQGAFDDILLANKGAAFDKLKVLPELPAIIEADSFYFDDLSDVPKLHSLDMNKAIKSGDDDIVLALRTVNGETFPASLMKLRSGLSKQLKNADEKIILGVYRERDGQIEQLSINEEYIKDGGKELREILERGLSEAVILEENIQVAYEKTLDSDGDGFTNEEERAMGTDPLNPQSKPGAKKEEAQTEPLLSELLESKDTKALAKHLKDGMMAYRNSDQYKIFLKAMAKFHDYSVANIYLLLRQNPDVSLVASFQKWKNDFGRQVQKGQKSLKVWVPMTIKLKDEKGNPKLDEHGNQMTVTRFKLGSVFDVSQTEGRDLPRPIYNLENGVTDYQSLYLATVATSRDNEVSVSFKPIENGANGYYHIENKEIVLADKKMSEAQIMKTLFHEMAHSDLHGKQDGYSASERELQAESVAYVVANHFGIDTSDYSFGYLHSWSTDKLTYEDLSAQLKVIQTEAKSLIQRIDAKLEQVKSKQLVTNKFQSKLSQAKEKVTQTVQDKATKEAGDLSKKPPTPVKEL
ncbi:PBECR4 domain-containing protein [Streptococcus cameli]